jgi:hypothetical protein
MQYLITIKNGKVTITVQGMAGAGCQGKSVEFAQLLGGKTEITGHTEEYYAQVAAKAQATVQRQ